MTPVPSGRMSRRLPALLLAVSVALAGAGVGTAIVRSDEPGPPADPRAAVVAGLAARPGGTAGTARYLVRYVRGGPDEREGFATYEGVADFERQRYLARGEIRRDDAEPGGAFDAFVFARWQYTRPVGETHWRRRTFDPRALGAPSPELRVVGARGQLLAGPTYVADAGVRAQLVDALVAGVGPLGRELQHGVEVWGYRVTLDGDRARGLLPGALVAEMGSWGELPERREVDVWLDGRQRLRKLSIFTELKDGLGFRVDNEFWDFGGPGPVPIPGDLDDATARDGEGVTSFTVEPGVDLDEDTATFSMWIFDGDQPGDALTVTVADRPAAGAGDRRRVLRLRPASGRRLEPGEYRLVDRAEFNRGVPRTFDVTAPEVEALCPRDRPRSGAVTVEEVVRYEERFTVRLRLRFRITCEGSGGAPPAALAGDLRFHALT